MTASEAQWVFYVAIDGDDAWSGSLKQPNENRTDGPLATLTGARDAIRELKRHGKAPDRGGIEVRIAPGEYPISRMLEFTDKDSGASGSPVVYRAWGDGQVVLSGGKTISQFTPVLDPAVVNRLPASARRAVLVADLKAERITDYGQMRSRGFKHSNVPAGLEVFFRGEPMQLARWPNEGYTMITGLPITSKLHEMYGVQIGCLEEGFIHNSSRPASWQANDDIWVHGFWAWDWANTYERVASIDPNTHLVKTRPNHGIYGFRVGQRFYYLNVLEELDSPGEWYLDRENGLLYFWPPEPLKQGQVEVSLLEEPLVLMNGTSHVSLQGLVFSCTRGQAVQIIGGQDNTIENCLIRNIGTSAVGIEGGKNHGVRACEIVNTGDGGIVMIGGDRATLEPCGHYARDNHLQRIARWSKCSSPAIHIDGVGHTAAGNLIHNHPHMAIRYLGNDHLIEFNEIHHVCLDTGDAGAIYSGRDYTCRGNVIRHNFIHHTGGVGIGSQGVYMDDNVSGTFVFGNVFWKVPRAMFIGGGRDHRVENNIFVDCDPAIHIDARGLDKSPVWHNMIYEYMKGLLGKMNWQQPPYSVRYPSLADLEKYLALDDGVPPENNILVRNISIGGRWIEADLHATPDMLEARDNLVDQDPRFVDAQVGNFELREDSPAWELGFQRIPLEKIAPPCPRHGADVS